MENAKKLLMVIKNLGLIQGQMNGLGKYRFGGRDVLLIGPELRDAWVELVAACSDALLSELISGETGRLQNLGLGKHIDKTDPPVV